MSAQDPSLMLPPGAFYPKDEAIPFQQQSLVSQDQLDKAALAQNTKSTTFGEAWDASKHDTSTIQATQRLAEATLDEAFPDYRLPDEGTPEFEAMTKGIPEDRWNEFAYATSPGSAKRIRENLLGSVQADRVMEQFGGPAAQIGMHILTSLTDPGTVALMAATGGVAGVMSKASLFAKIGSIALTEGVAAGATERYLQTSRSSHDLTPVALAASLAMVGAGVFVGAPAAWSAAANRAFKGAARDAVHDAADAAAGRSGSLADGDHAGSASTGKPVEDLATGMWEQTVPKTVMNDARWSVAAKAGASDSPAFRKAGTLVEDALGVKADGSANHIPSTHRQQLMMNQRQVEFYQIAKPEFHAWMKENNVPWYRRFSDEIADKFMRESTWAMSEGVGSPQALKVGKALNESMKKTLQEAKDAGVAGTEFVTHDAHHLPHIWKLQDMVAGFRFYKDGMTRLYAKAIFEAGMGTVEQKHADRLAHTILTTMRRAEAGMETDLSHVTTRDGLEQLHKRLLAEGMSEADATATIRPFMHDTGDATAPTRLRPRTLLDVHTEMELLNHETGVMETVAVKDFMEQNAERIHNMYTRQLTGRIALAKNGIKDYAQYKQLIQTARAEAQDMGENANDVAKAMEFMWKAVTGAPLDPNYLGLGAKVGRTVGSFNFLRLMGEMGMAQAVEASHLVSENGLRTVFQHIPTLGSMFRRMRDGTFRLDNDLAREVESMGWGGSDLLRESITTHAGTESEYFFGKGVIPQGRMKALAHSLNDKVETTTIRAKRGLMHVSGFASLNTMLHRQAGKVVAQKFFDLAIGAKELTPSVVKRLKTFGLSDDMQERVLREMRANATPEDSVFGNGSKVKRMNTDKWTDKEAADAFTHAGYAMGRRIIQENDVGSSAMWMHSTLGKVLMQFRMFQAGSWEKNTLHNTSMKDFQTAHTWTLNLGTAAMVYMLRTYVNSIGRPDQQEHLNKELTIGKIARSSYGMSSWSSIIPMTLDSAWMWTGGEAPILGRASSTGLQHGILGIPAVDAFLKSSEALKGIRRSISGEGASRSQRRAQLNMLAFSNTYAIRNLINNVTADMPKATRSRFEDVWYNEK